MRADEMQEELEANESEEMEQRVRMNSVLGNDIELRSLSAESHGMEIFHVLKSLFNLCLSHYPEPFRPCFLQSKIFSFLTQLQSK